MDVAVGHLDQGFFDSIGIDDFAMVNFGPESLAVVGNRGVKVVDGYGDVVNFCELHASKSTRLNGTRRGCSLPVVNNHPAFKGTAKSEFICVFEIAAHGQAHG